MKSEFEIAITQLCADRNLAPEVILEAIEAALVSAYKRNYGANQNITVSIDPRSGQAHVYVTKTVVEKVEDERLEISLAEARLYKENPAIGDQVTIEVKPRNFGRIAAQTAKQVIMQRIREAERDSVYLEYADRADEVVTGVVRNIDARSGNVTISLGKAEALLAKSEQIPGENYRFNQRLRVYIVEVERTGHGPQITVSRAHRGLLRRLLELEVPEIYNGTVEIKAIAREAGSRSKVAVAAAQPGVDPVGSCVGMRGVRIQNIVNELNGEKIDVVAWSPNPQEFIANALSPAKVVAVYLNEEEKAAKVIVPDKSLSLAIGKEGQNARLAAKLTGWRIDIRSESEAAAEAERFAAEAAEAAARARELELARQEAAKLLAEAEATLAGEEEPEALPAAETAPAQGPLPEAAVEEQPAPETALPEPALAESAPSAEAVSAEAPAPAEPAPALAEELGPTEAPGERELAPVAEQEVVWEEEELEEEELDEGEGGKRKKPSDKKKRQRLYEFDDRLGRVVARKKRKPSRIKGWEDDEDWEE
jgi:N utilization substance protein A